MGKAISDWSEAISDWSEAIDPPRLPRWAGGGCCGNPLCSYGIPDILGNLVIPGNPLIPGNLLIPGNP